MRLIFTGDGGVMPRDFVKRLCPWCHSRFVLWVYPGGFGACSNPECKSQALDASMDWEEAKAQR